LPNKRLLRKKEKLNSRCKKLKMKPRTLIQPVLLMLLKLEQEILMMTSLLLKLRDNS